MNREAQRRRVKSGQSAEDVCELHNQLCYQHGLASVYRVPTNFRVVGKGLKHLKVVPLQKSAPDFFGTMADGRCLMVEVKSSLDGRFCIKSLPLHQRTALADNERRGGVSVLFFVSPTGCYAVPFAAFVELSKLVRTIVFVDLQRWEVRKNVPYLVAVIESYKEVVL